MTTITRPPKRSPARRVARPGPRPTARPTGARPPARPAAGPTGPWGGRAIDPRWRDRRVAVTRDQGRRRLRRLVIALVLVGVPAAAVGVVFSPVLDVDRVAVVGVGPARADVVRAAARVSRGSPLLRVDTGAVARRLDALPWVGRAVVRRELPGTLTVRITPRVAVAWTRAADGSVELLSAQGAVIGTVAGIPAALPEASGPLRSAGRIAAALPEALRSRVADIVVEHDDGVLHLIQGPEIRLGAVTDVSAKAEAAAAVLTALGSAPAHYIDVQVAAAPAVG